MYKYSTRVGSIAQEFDLFAKTTKDYKDYVTYKSGSTVVDIARQVGKIDVVNILEDEINRRNKDTKSLFFLFYVFIFNKKKQTK
jgi:hypothetical protein